MERFLKQQIRTVQEMEELESDSLRKESLERWRNLKMEDLRGQLNAGHTVIENGRPIHGDFTYQRQSKTTEVLLWNLKRAEVGEREEGENGRVAQAKEVLRESGEENKGEGKDKKQQTGEADRQQETEPERGDVYSDLNKTPGLWKDVCRNGEKAVKEEREIETGGEEIPRAQAKRKVKEQSAADTTAAQAPIPNETGRPTKEGKEEKDLKHQEGEPEVRAACGGENEVAALPNSTEDSQHLGGAAAGGPEKEESVELKKGKKTRRGKRGRRKKRAQTENATDWSEYEEEEEEYEEEDNEESGWGTDNLHRRRAEEMWCYGVSSPPEGDLRQRFYPGRQICYGQYYYTRVERRREGKEEEERRGRPHRGPAFRDRRLGERSREEEEEEEEERRGRARPEYCRRPVQRRPYGRGGFYARERWMNGHQEGLYSRQRWMNDPQEAVCAPRRECMERERRMEAEAWMETGTELWNRHWEEAAGTGVGMRLSFWSPRGRERGDRWSYQRVRRQLVKHSAQR